MARIELPSGAWVEYRDKLKAADKFAVQDSIRLSIDDGVQLVTGGIQNSMRNALLGRVISSWSFEGVPIPSQNIAGDEIIGELLELDDYDALSKAVEPLMEKVSFSAAANASPNRKRSGN
jgi:hypothetical protein